MKRKIIRGAAAVTLLLSLVFTMAGCGGKRAGSGKHVSLYLRHPYETQVLLPYLTGRFPDVTFDLMVGDNGAENLALLAGHGDLPDIFIVNGAGKSLGELGPYCYDLKETEVAASVYSSYRRRFTNPDGSIYLLPSMGEPSGMLVSKTLLEQNDIPLPADYESYISACRSLAALGIKGYAPDGKYAISLSTMMVGLGAERLASVEGSSWLTGYEDGDTQELSPDVWLPIFEDARQFVEDGGLELDSVTHDDKGYGYNDMWSGLREGTSAMVRGTVSSVLAPPDVDDELILMPWFAPGATEDNAFLLVEEGQGICAGINKSSMEDPERAKLIMEVYEAIYSQEALQLLMDVYGGGWISFTSRASLSLPPQCENLAPYIERNHLVLMLDKHIQEALNAGFRAMVMDGQSPEAALETANEALEAALTPADAAPEDVLFTSQSAYSANFDREKGNQTASVIANTVREYLGADILINPYIVQNAPVYAMDYTATQAGDLCAPSAYRAMLGDVTGAELLDIARASVEAVGYPDAAVGGSSLPVVSGGQITVKKTESGYQFGDLTVGGQPVDPARTYHAVVVDFDGVPDRFSTCALEPLGLLDRFAIYEDNSYMRNVFVEAATARGGFAEPSDYIRLEG